jgi:hypothetical protein
MQAAPKHYRPLNQTFCFSDLPPSSPFSGEVKKDGVRPVLATRFPKLALVNPQHGLYK